jgi:hypothetical protein
MLQCVIVFGQEHTEAFGNKQEHNGAFGHRKERTEAFDQKQ